MASTGLQAIPPTTIRPNPKNPRRFFNEAHLDLLRTSIQEVGILVPLVVFEDPEEASDYVLLDGERRLRSSLDLALPEVPVQIIPKPSPLENLLRMFNIHNVREDWPLISVALSLREVMEISGEQRETRLAEMTGLTRSTVRRARRLLRIPEAELKLIESEAHLPRTEQVHREDVYLEVERAISALRGVFDDHLDEYSDAQMYRFLVTKIERGAVPNVTDYRLIPRVAKTYQEGHLDEDAVRASVVPFLKDADLGPRDWYRKYADVGYQQSAIQRKAELLLDDLEQGPSAEGASDAMLLALRDLYERLRIYLGET
jgi:ParB family transcriptional regulator, chromosome partitioning protein